MSTRVRTVRGVVAVALAAFLVVPAAAWALPGLGMRNPQKPNVSRSTTATMQQGSRRQMLQERIENALANRKRAFDPAAERIRVRIENAAAIADRAAAAGGDISAVTPKLDEARAAVAAALASEDSAIAMFKAVPDATDRKAAFGAAKAEARAARRHLVEARAALRAAILELHVIVNGLEGAVQ